MQCKIVNSYETHYRRTRNRTPKGGVESHRPATVIDIYIGFLVYIVSIAVIDIETKLNGLVFLQH